MIKAAAVKTAAAIFWLLRDKTSTDFQNENPCSLLYQLHEIISKGPILHGDSLYYTQNVHPNHILLLHRPISPGPFLDGD
jgi:hypothetical protein